MKTLIAMTALLGILAAGSFGANGYCVKDGLQTNQGKKACEKGGGRWELKNTPKKATPKKKGGN